MMSAVSAIMDFLTDPLPNFCFQVDIYQPLIPTMSAKDMTGKQALLALALSNPLATAFTKVSGLSLSFDGGDGAYNEGGNNIPVNLPKRMKNETLTLERYLRPCQIAPGKYSLDGMTDWCQQTFKNVKTWSKKIEPKDLLISIYNPLIKNPLPVGPAAFPIAGFSVINAFPVKWAVSELSSMDDNTPITETIEFAYEEIKRISLPPI